MNIKTACQGLMAALLFLATTHLFAQQCAPVNDANFYLETYAKQLAALQEIRFSFSGHQTRSTPKLGVVATWQNSGTVRVSAKRQSFHCTQAATLTQFEDKPPKCLGIREKLITPDTFLDVNVLSDTADSPERRFHVASKTKTPENEWAKEIGDHQLGILLGYAPFGIDNGALLTNIRAASTDFLTDKVFDSKRLSGFLVKREELEIRALFDVSVDSLAKHVQVSRRSKSTKVGDVVKAVLTVLDVGYAESKPTSIKLRITLERAGGTIKGSDIPGVPRSRRAQAVELEPQTWSYYYDITDIQYQDDRGDWFALDHPIPNESPAVLDGDLEGSYVWRDGRVHRIGIDDFELLLPNEKPENEPADARVAERLDGTIRNIRPCGMHCLVILEGNLPARILNLDHPELEPYLPLVLSQNAINANASTLAALKWPLPQAGEVMLVALDGDGQLLGTQRLKFSASDDAATLASAFLKRHRPPVRDAQVRLAEARADAKRTNRKVCVVVSGVRCGPCFRLARWMNDQHGLLDKDYVILKVMAELDSHAQEVIYTLDGPIDGIPWFAITSAEGKILATSDGPMGNIGMPSSPEDIRHMREILDQTATRLTDEELDRLVKSLVDYK